MSRTFHVYAEIGVSQTLFQTPTLQEKGTMQLTWVILLFTFKVNGFPFSRAPDNQAVGKFFLAIKIPLITGICIFLIFKSNRIVTGAWYVRRWWYFSVGIPFT